MTKIDALRRLLPCLSPTTATSKATATPIKKRLSTSLRNDVVDPLHPVLTNTNQDKDKDSQDSTTTTDLEPPVSAFSRPSRSMVIGTIFGQRKGHVWFCFQHHRLSTKPSLLLELSIPTHQLVQEMSSGTVRIALECDHSELGSCPLHSVPIWTMHCNGRKIGFATKRKATRHNRLMLKTMQSITVGAGMIPTGVGSSGSEEIMYMRASYEHVIGNSDYESFHLVNPDECAGQELSVYLMRSRKLGFSLTPWEASQICFLLGVSFKFFKRLESGALHCKELLFAGTAAGWTLSNLYSIICSFIKLLIEDEGRESCSWRTCRAV
ncbi:hypothetical protein Golob_015504 [Gossypium lobatum]|uniref:Protein MIZU-KUSSEI 1 n=1 Tax=Gossypium lobatum TaxID=34289 RepID=A0A7J8M197_9ROSI|nr:hypothetical protein [Gossypium lobatum]